MKTSTKQTSELPVNISIISQRIINDFSKILELLHIH